MNTFSQVNPQQSQFYKPNSQIGHRQLQQPQFNISQRQMSSAQNFNQVSKLEKSTIDKLLDQKDQRFSLQPKLMNAEAKQEKDIQEVLQTQEFCQNFIENLLQIYSNNVISVADSTLNHNNPEEKEILKREKEFVNTCFNATKVSPNIYEENKDNRNMNLQQLQNTYTFLDTNEPLYKKMQEEPQQQFQQNLQQPINIVDSLIPNSQNLQNQQLNSKNLLLDSQYNNWQNQPFTNNQNMLNSQQVNQKTKNSKQYFGDNENILNSQQFQTNQQMQDSQQYFNDNQEKIVSQKVPNTQQILNSQQGTTGNQYMINSQQQFPNNQQRQNVSKYYSDNQGIQTTQQPFNQKLSNISEKSLSCDKASQHSDYYQHLALYNDHSKKSNKHSKHSKSIKSHKSRNKRTQINFVENFNHSRSQNKYNNQGANTYGSTKSKSQTYLARDLQYPQEIELNQFNLHSTNKNQGVQYKLKKKKKQHNKYNSTISQYKQNSPDFYRDYKKQKHSKNAEIQTKIKPKKIKEVDELFQNSYQYQPVDVEQGNQSYSIIRKIPKKKSKSRSKSKTKVTQCNFGDQPIQQTMNFRQFKQSKLAPKTQQIGVSTDDFNAKQKPKKKVKINESSSQTKIPQENLYIVQKVKKVKPKRVQQTLNQYENQQEVIPQPVQQPINKQKKQRNISKNKKIQTNLDQPQPNINMSNQVEQPQIEKQVVKSVKSKHPKKAQSIAIQSNVIPQQKINKKNLQSFGIQCDNPQQNYQIIHKPQMVNTVSSQVNFPEQSRQNYHTQTLETVYDGFNNLSRTPSPELQQPQAMQFQQYSNVQVEEPKKFKTKSIRNQRSGPSKSYKYEYADQDDQQIIQAENKQQGIFNETQKYSKNMQTQYQYQYPQSNEEQYQTTSEEEEDENNYQEYQQSSQLPQFASNIIQTSQPVVEKYQCRSQGSQSQKQKMYKIKKAKKKQKKEENLDESNVSITVSVDYSQQTDNQYEDDESNQNNEYYFEQDSESSQEEKYYIHKQPKQNRKKIYLYKNSDNQEQHNNQTRSTKEPRYSIKYQKDNKNNVYYTDESDDDLTQKEYDDDNEQIPCEFHYNQYKQQSISYDDNINSQISTIMKESQTDQDNSLSIKLTLDQLLQQ